MKNPRHYLYSLLFSAFLLLQTGCASIGPGGAAPGFIYSDTTYPNDLNPNMQHQILFDRDDIELLGPVDASAKSTWIAFVYSGGDSGYAELMRQARAQGADGVMNVTVDTNFQWYFILFAKVTTKLSAQGYRYRRMQDEKTFVQTPINSTQ
ncbi:MAG: hypothetical protein ACFCU1_05635 [Sumerlaeia bacterium]